MAVFNGFFPIRTSDDAALAFVAQLTGPRVADWTALREQIGITRETWAMQQSPMGTFMLVWFESDDIEGCFGRLANDDSEFGVWYKGQILEHTGADLDAPPQGPPPELLINWSR